MSQPPVPPPGPSPYGSPHGTPPGSPYGPVAPYGGGYQPPPSKTMAGWALALALLICIPFGFLVSIGLAIAVLVKSRDGRDHGRTMAIAALCIATLVFLAQVGLFAFGLYKGVTEGIDAPRDSQGNVTERTEVTVENLRVGDCFDDDTMLGATQEGVQATTAEAVPCAQPHHFEIYHTFEIPGDDYPGSDKVDALADEGCSGKVRSFLGGQPARGSDLSIYLYYPQKRTWNLLGDHSVQCVIGRSDPLIQGSLRGTGRP
ncbi:septum formation family protein [Nocardioides sp.]|uniref:septum formation family protein n=1 Tax=Nocardioides sp. TaxID=35761 RepID=UPI003D114828